ncbi:glycosyltransferase family 4 protein [Fundicoccus ignavus]|nr:glycosyltransferase family 4 protein [Fundicoccus ignavus]
MENKLRLIPYGVDLDMFSYVKRVWKPGTTLKILTVAGISLRKGINYLLDAMDELQGYNIKLSVLGVPIGEEGRALVARMKDMKNVDYRGSVSHIEINKAYQDNDLFILPSLVEGSALSVYEALATGMPCIVTNNTGSVVDNGVDGFIIEEESAKSIVQAIQCIYTQEINIEHMSVSARRKAENYSWNHFEDRIASFYDSIL